jgi:hypothetical protein
LDFGLACVVVAKAMECFIDYVFYIPITPNMKYYFHLVPPTAPLLHATAVTADSVRLQWKQGDNGGSAIRGFILNFRPLDGEWEEITLSRKLSTYQVEDLRCGQTYEFFLSGWF